MKLTIHRFHA